MTQSNFFDERPVPRVTSNRIESRMNSKQKQSWRFFLDAGFQPFESIVHIAEAGVQRCDRECRDHSDFARLCHLAKNPPRLGFISHRLSEMCETEISNGNSV